MCLVVIVLVSVSICSVDREGGTLHCGVGATAIMDTTGNEKAMDDHTNEEDDDDEDYDDEDRMMMTMIQTKNCNNLYKWFFHEK